VAAIRLTADPKGHYFDGNEQPLADTLSKAGL